MENQNRLKLFHKQPLSNTIIIVSIVILVLGICVYIYVDQPYMLIRQFRNDNPLIQQQAADELARMGERAINPLIKASKDKEWKVRYYATEALVKSKDPRVIDTLIFLLKDPEWNVRTKACDWLGRTNDPKAIGALIDVIHTSQPGMDWLAYYGVTRNMPDFDPRKLDIAIEMLGHGGRMSYKNLYDDLRKYGKLAESKLIDELKSPNGAIKYGVFHAIEELQITDAIPQLVNLLNDKNQSARIRWPSTHALGELGDKRVIPPLISVLNDKDSSVEYTAYHALCKRTGQNFGHNQEKWKEWWKKNKNSFP